MPKIFPSRPRFLHIAMDVETQTALTQLTKSLDMSKSEIVRALIMKEYMEENEMKSIGMVVGNV